MAKEAFLEAPIINDYHRLFLFTKKQTYSEGAVHGWTAGYLMGTGLVGAAEAINGMNIDISKDGTYTISDASSPLARAGNVLQFGLGLPSMPKGFKAPKFRTWNQFQKGTKMKASLSKQLWKNYKKDYLFHMFTGNKQGNEAGYRLTKAVINTPAWTEGVSELLDLSEIIYSAYESIDRYLNE